MKILTIVFITYALYACQWPHAAEQNTGIDILTIKKDGTMFFRERSMNEEDVIIYDDGFGGERAAIKVYVPFKEDYFRDSIRVYRETSEAIISDNGQ
jgi:hypothetical protein